MLLRRGQVIAVDEGQIVRELLLGGNPRARVRLQAAYLRIDFQPADPEEALQPLRHRALQGLAEQRVGTGLDERLLLDAPSRGDTGIDGRFLADSDQIHQLVERKGRVGAVAEIELAGRPGKHEGDVHVANARLELDVQHWFGADRIDESDFAAIDAVAGAEHANLALRDADRAEDRRVGDGPDHVDVEICLDFAH